MLLAKLAPLSERRQRLYCQILRSLEARFIFLSSKKSKRRQEVDLVNLRLFQEWWSPLLWEENCHRAIVLNSVQGSTVRRRSPWKTGQHSQQERTGEDEGPSQLKDAEDNTGPKLRKSTPMWKPNPKYENSAYAEVMKGEAVLSNTSEALKEKSGGVRSGSKSDSDSTGGIYNSIFWGLCFRQ